MNIEDKLDFLRNNLEGELYRDEIMRVVYSTDASAYREKPIAVAMPKTNDDIKKLIAFAIENSTTIIPRTAGTSLAGQVVGNGIVVDVSKHMTKILEVNKDENWVRVQPGIILDELNLYLKKEGLFFGPETSTANRCMIGGMVGNNACGLHSLIYGSTRDHTISVKGILSDGSELEFAPLSNEEFEAKTKGGNLENKIYKHIKTILSDSNNQKEIRKEFPDKTLRRRNNGYAIDLLLESEPFTLNNKKFNFSNLIAGSEGTLLFMTEIKLNLIPLPPPVKGIVAVHCKTLEQALLGNLVALKYNPGAVELMDNVILDLTKDNIEQNKNRFFLNGNPGAILIVEFARENKDQIEDICREMEQEMRDNDLAYHFPLIYDDDIKKVWNLRKSGLGLLSNMPGDAKPVSVTEDTAVDVNKLPEYIKEFKILLSNYNLKCVFHAHIATGELHLRPVLNLKDKKDVEIFHDFALDTAKLVKKFKGSLSGEHGDGRLRGEFIPLMIGEKNYALLKELKHLWDPYNVFNANKIIDTPSMNTSLRYETGKKTREIKTIFDFSKTQGILRAVEKCNGSGDCRKTELIGGTLCPSYQASRNENTTTRARANVLREYLTHSNKNNPFDHMEIYKIMDLCLSCKACKSECPSSVDIAKLKAEFLQHYYDVHGIPLRTRLIAYITKVNSLGAIVPSVFNFFVSNKFFSNIFKRSIGFASQRSIPRLYKMTLRKWAKHNISNLNNNLTDTAPVVHLFVDEFTNYNDTLIGIKAIKLLNKLGYKVLLPRCTESGRTYLSKGLIRTAKKKANKNIALLKNIISDETPLVGIEPSAILAFRDEYPELANSELIDASKNIAKSAFMFDEFIVRELDNGKINSEIFTKAKKEIKLHGHCQQKAIASTESTKRMLSIPENYSVIEIPSGCCGMAGSFGYEKEHYNLSMKVGELVLFPAVRNTSQENSISAPGTSCRHQIKDGTGRNAEHPVEILWEALRL